MGVHKPFEGLLKIVRGDQLLGGPAVERAYDCDAYTVDRSAPGCVALPETVDQVRDIVLWCLDNSVPFTPRGAGTGLSGGAMPAKGGVVVSTKRLTKILEVDLENRCLHAEAGAVNNKLSEAAKPYGLHFAPDPSSQSVCTLGGNINENSGGPHTLKYGVTAQHVFQVTMVDSHGRYVTYGSRVPNAPGPDIKSLIVGSEGTLGIVTSAWVRLVPVPGFVQTALVSFADVRQATQTVADIIGQGVVPAALEMMDRNVMVALRAAFGLQFPEQAGALLLIECDGDRALVLEEFAEVVQVCEKNLSIEIRIAADDGERAELWKARKKGIGAMGRLAPTILTHDGVIPRSKLPEMLDFVYGVAEEAGVGVANIFHAGDGNLHPCFYFDDRVPGMVERVVEAGETILKKCLELGGSVTGEHGIGVEKASVWARSLRPSDLAMQLGVRHVFDVDDLCNPCKLIPDQKGCIEHVRRWRGAAS